MDDVLRILIQHGTLHYLSVSGGAIFLDYATYPLRRELLCHQDMLSPLVKLVAVGVWGVGVGLGGVLPFLPFLQEYTNVIFHCRTVFSS